MASDDDFKVVFDTLVLPIGNEFEPEVSDRSRLEDKTMICRLFYCQLDLIRSMVM